MERPEKKILLVGLGNPLNGDDGFGPLVIERLRSTASEMPPGVTLRDAGTDLLHHIEDFAGYDCVVLIDAILDTDSKLRAPGHIEVLEEKAIVSWPESSQGVHQMSPLLGVKLFRALYPEAGTRICLAGLFVDQVSHTPRYINEDRLKKAVDAIHCVLKS